MKKIKLFIIILLIFVASYFSYSLISDYSMSKKPGVHIIFNSKDVAVEQEVESLKIVDGHYVYLTNCVKKRATAGIENSDCSVIFDGKKIGQTTYHYTNNFFSLDELGRLVYKGKILTKPTKNTDALYQIKYIDNQPHLFINNQDRGALHIKIPKSKSSKLTVSDANGFSAFDSNLFKSIIFDGENFGYVTPKCDVYYNNELVGKCYSSNWPKTKQLLHLSNGHYGFINNEGYIIYDGKKLGKGRGLSLSGDNYAYIDSEDYLVYNGKRLNLGVVKNKYGTKNLDKSLKPLILDGDNYGYEERGFIVYNGKFLGNGKNLQLANGNYGFERADGHIIYNGKDMGPGYNLQLAGDSYVFLRKVE